MSPVLSVGFHWRFPGVALLASYNFLMSKHVVYRGKQFFLVACLSALTISQFSGCSIGHSGANPGRGGNQATGGRGEGSSGGSDSDSIGQMGSGMGGNSQTVGRSGDSGGQSSGVSGSIGQGGSSTAGIRGQVTGGSGSGGKTGERGGGTSGLGSGGFGSGARGPDGMATGGQASADSGSGGQTAGGFTGTGGSNGEYTVAMVQSSMAQATDITQDEIRTLVSDAVTQVGGLDFIKAGQTVVLKPNLLVSTSDGFKTLLPVEVNGITTDWRVVKAVAELVRAKVGSSGKILVMEGSTESTTQAFGRLGYTSVNFGTDVDEFIPLEGTSCSDRSTTGLAQKSATNGTQYWINQRYLNADVVISLPVMKTHFQAGITGGVKNLGIGTTPASQYAKNGCGRDQVTLIPHSPVEPLSHFIADYFSLRPPDLVVMDALQGIQHGPLPAWAGGNYNQDKMNMRLILASRNAVALDTIEALVMNCNPKKVPHLTKLEASGLGTTDSAKITVKGKQVSEIHKTFAGPAFACPGT
jgi:uncharacterized protein (DUF362 family)